MIVYSYEDSKAILRNPDVHRIMARVVHGREIAPAQTPSWPFDGRDNPTAPFVLLAACVERAVAEAMRNTKGREHERLLTTLRATPTDDPDKIAEAVADSVEGYAVEMQFGVAGLNNYREFQRSAAWPITS